MRCFCQFRLVSAAVVILILSGARASAQGHREFSLPGYQPVVREIEIKPEKQLETTVDVTLEPGAGLSENGAGQAGNERNAAAQTDVPPPPPPPPPPIRTNSSRERANVKRVKVSETVMQGRLLQHVQPVYPSLARQARIFGEVVLQATIGKDGTVKDVEIVRGNPLLAPSAMDAVKQWRYKPWVVNGAAVAVDTQITVNFDLPEETASPSPEAPSASDGSSSGAQTESAQVQNQVPDVQLAATANHFAMPGRNKEDAVILTVTQDGRLFLRGDQMSPVDPIVLVGRIKDQLANRVDKTVYVNADARARYGAIEQVLSQLADAGVDLVDLLTRPHDSSSNSEVPPAGLEVIIPLPALPVSGTGRQTQRPGTKRTTQLDLSLRRAPGVVPAGTGANDPIIVQVLQGPTGVQWKINRQSVADRKDLATRLGSIFQGRDEKIVFFKANGTLAFSDVIDAIDAIRGSGVEKVGIITGNIE